jgi:hypothetical protein
VKLLADLTQAPGPAVLVARHGATDTVFGYHSADPYTGPRCGRCNRLLHIHVWQLVDGGDVLDCATEARP